MQNLAEMYSKWKAGEYEATDKELVILKAYELVLNHSPEDEQPDRELQLDLLLDDIQE